MVQNSQVNLFISYFCKELSLQLEATCHPENVMEHGEFMKLVTETTQEIVESYNAGEADLFMCHNSMAEEYKEIALKSIDSYSTTNENIEKISEQQAILFHQANVNKLIDIEQISARFNEIQNHLCEEVSRANGVIHDLMKQIRSLETKNSLDPLTKAYNRYALHEYLQTILFKETLDFDVFALMVDIDNFKQINDGHGHIAGDKVLIFITKLMKKALREGDRVYRFGGEEFIILLNRTDLEGATMVAERLLTLCRQNQPFFQHVQIPVTLSIGLTKIVDGDTIESIISRSDSALYRAKNNGKDRIEMEF